MCGQTSDNWTSIRYSLADYYEARNGENARLMTELACIAWNAVVRRRESGGTVLATIQFHSVPCDLIEDYSHIWRREFVREENRILSHFEKVLREWAAAGDSVRLETALDRFAARNRASLMWSVFMEVGVEHPSTLGVLLEEVLNESLFLTHPDYSYGGAALLGALHKAGDVAKREQLERLILELPANARFLRDEPREPMPAWLEYAQNRLLGALEESNIVLSAAQNLWRERHAANELPLSRKLEPPQVTSHTLTNAEIFERKGIDLNEPVNQELFNLREALKPFLERDSHKIDVAELERQWPVIGQSERAVKRHRKLHEKMAEDLWGHLVGVCENTVRHANWPKTNERWKTVRRILLRAAGDPIPQASDDEDAKEDRWPSWGWLSPRLDAARGLPLLVYRLGQADKAVVTALRHFCQDKSHPLRFNFAERIALLEQSASGLMWELADTFITKEKKFSVLEKLLLSLDPLWEKAPDEVMRRLRVISDRVMQSAPADNHIHGMLASMYLFRFLRIGDTECEAFIVRLIEECDSPRASHSLDAQLHTCRSEGWLTTGDGVTPDAQIDAARARTWSFFARLLTAAQAKLQRHREQWRQLHEHGHPNAEVAKSVQEGIKQAGRLVDGIAMQLYFASGAYDEKQPKEEKVLSKMQLQRFWKESAPLLKALATEPHPHTADHLVQTLHHLLPCAPREVFLLAMKSSCTSAEVGFQHESLAVGDVVKLIQRALVDHRDIFQSAGDKESDCLEALLKVLDLFVEAGWAEARQLTHRLEEIYR